MALSGHAGASLEGEQWRVHRRLWEGHCEAGEVGRSHLHPQSSVSTCGGREPPQTVTVLPLTGERSQQGAVWKAVVRFNSHSHPQLLDTVICGSCYRWAAAP